MRSLTLMVPLMAIIAVGLARPATVSADGSARYLFEIDNTWSETTHPGAIPGGAHFSWFGGATHNDQITFWSEGDVASPAMVQMAETGVTRLLVEEAARAVAGGEVFSVIDQNHWFCPVGFESPSCGPSSFEVNVDEDFPLLTLVSMLGPSPDWFVGVSALPLRENGDWIDRIDYELFPYDGGSRSANVFKLFGPENEPAEPIALITEESGQLITNRSLGQLIIRRINDCDLNMDFACDAADIDLLSESARVGDSLFDLNGDGSTTEADRVHWVEELMGTSFGDADLNGLVRFDDFLALVEGFGKTGGWAAGDFDGSGKPEFNDFLALLENFDVGVAAVSVPEPLSSWWVALFLGYCAAAAIRRKNQTR